MSAPESTPPHAISGRRRKVYGVLVSVFVTIILLLIVEIALRIGATRVVAQSSSLRGEMQSAPDLLIWYEPNGEKRLVPNAKVVIKNHHLSGRDIQIETNSLGFRDQEFPSAKKPGEIRVLVLGDSITFGDYVQADEVYMKRAQQYLNAQQGQHRFFFINAGVGDAGTKEEIDLLAETVSKVHPDYVVLSFFLNDSRPPWGFPKELGRTGWLRRNSVLANTIYTELKLSRWMKERGAERFEWGHAARTLRWPQEPSAFKLLVGLAKYDWGSAWYDESWQSLRPEFDRLASMAETNQFKVVIVGFPVAFQVYAEFLENHPQIELKDEAARRHFYFLDLLPVLRSVNQQRLFYDHCHPNVVANDIIGKALADYFGSQIQ